MIHGRGTAGKQSVFGMVERKGGCVATTVPNVSRVALEPKVVERVIPTSTVYTDELRSYDYLADQGYNHERVNHSEKVYVSGAVHTNTIEGFRSLTKRGINGVYHAVSSKHLQGYLNEYAWRYSLRDDGRAMFETLILRATGG